MARCSATRIGLVAALAALAPATSGAVVEVRSNLTLTQGHDDNVLTQEENEIADHVTTVTPELSLRGSGERGSLGASGRLSARRYADVDALDALDRSFAVDGDYWITPRLQITSFGRSAYYENTDEVMEAGVPLAGDAPDLDTLEWNGTLRYLVSPRTALTLSPGFNDWDFGKQADPGAADRTDSRSEMLMGGIERTLSTRDSIGLDLARAENTFEQDLAEDTGSAYRQARLRWSRVWSTLWSSSLSAGATQVQQDGQEIDFSGLLPGETDPNIKIDDTSLSGVGELLLSRQTPWTTFSFGGSQSVSPSSGFGTDLVVLTFSSRFDWRLNRRWTFSASAFWSDSQATGDSIDNTQPLGTRGDIIVLPDPTAPGSTTSLFDAKNCNARSAAVTTGRDLGPSLALDAQGNPLLDGDGNVVVGRRFETSCVGVTDTAVDYQQQGFTLGLSWRMTRRFSTFLSYRFLDQSAGGDTDLEEYNRTVVSLGFTYRYDVDLY